MSLESLGADSRVHSTFQPFSTQGFILARVITSQRNLYRLSAESGEWSAEASGSLWYRTAEAAAMPVTGDWVAARIVDEGRAIVEAVLPRKTFFSRRAAGRREDQQPIAANIDLVFVVCGLDGDFNLRRIERYLTLTAESGADAVIVLSKSDLSEDLCARLAETAGIANATPVIAASSRTPDGLDGVRSYLAYGRTIALLGSSGAGKSTLVNALLGEEKLRTTEVRAHDSRGRHTTTHRELIPLASGGALIDTPGMRELQLWASEDSVDRTFEDVVDFAAHCRFRDCSHSGESGCAVADALAGGRLSTERFTSYRKLKGEARRHEAMADPVAAEQGKKKVKAMHKAMRNYYRRRDP